MRFLIFTVIFTLQANASVIEEKANQICKLASLCEVYQGSSTTIKGLVFEYAEFVNEEPLGEEDYREFDYDPGIDEVIWGRFSMKQALGFVRLHGDEDYGSQESPSIADLKKINKLIIEMIGTGVEFGFSSSTGGNVCGAVFPGLLILDKKAKKVYDIGLFGYPSC